MLALGVAILIAVFGAIFVLTVKVVDDVKVALAVWGIALAGTGLVVLAAWLIGEGLA